MYASHANKPASALASGAIVAGMLAMLVSSLDAEQVVQTARTLVAVNISPPKPSPTPTPTPPPPKSEKAAPKGDPGQRNLKNKATQIVAVKPPILIVKPPPVVVATTPANTGNATQSGMSDRPGPGQGAGDYGSGLGGGGTGGDGGGAVVGPKRIRGRLAFEDLPDGYLAEGEMASVEVRYTVEVSGRVSGCRPIRSSGYPAIDSAACRLIERRFIYRPALNRAGRPVRAVVGESHTWVVNERG